MDRAAGVLGLVHDPVSGGGEIVLGEAFAHRHPACREKGVGHSPADDEVLNLADEVAEHVELARYLGPADHRRDRGLWIAQRSVERRELALH